MKAKYFEVTRRTVPLYRTIVDLLRALLPLDCGAMKMFHVTDINASSIGTAFPVTNNSVISHFLR